MNNNGTPTAWLDSEAGQKLQKRLSNEQTLNGLEGLLAKIDSLEKAVTNLTTMMQQGPGMVAMVADMADEAYQKADANGVSIDERLGNAMVLAEKLTAPAMVEKLDGLMTLADQAPGLIAMTMDMVDEGMKDAIDKGLDLSALGDIAGASNRALTAAKAEPPAKVGGIFGLLRVLKDSDRQKGLGFLMNFLKHLGRNI